MDLRSPSTGSSNCNIYGRDATHCSGELSAQFYFFGSALFDRGRPGYPHWTCSRSPDPRTSSGGTGKRYSISKRDRATRLEVQVRNQRISSAKRCFVLIAALLLACFAACVPDQSNQ